MASPLPADTTQKNLGGYETPAGGGDTCLGNVFIDDLKSFPRARTALRHILITRLRWSRV